MNWLARPLTVDDVVVAMPLDPATITDTDLRDICIRMYALLDSFEMPICEGRLLPLDIFESILDLADRIEFHGEQPPNLSEWKGLIEHFGTYYRLAGCGPILVERKSWLDAIAFLSSVEPAEPHDAPDTHQI